MQNKARSLSYGVLLVISILEFSVPVNEYKICFDEPHISIQCLKKPEQISMLLTTIFVPIFIYHNTINCCFCSFHSLISNEIRNTNK